MKTDRRNFFSKLLGGGSSVLGLSALQAIVPVAQAAEIRQHRRYLVKMRGFLSPEDHHGMELWLKEKGIDAAVIDDTVQEIFEIEPPLRLNGYAI